MRRVGTLAGLDRTAIAVRMVGVLLVTVPPLVVIDDLQANFRPLVLVVLLAALATLAGLSGRLPSGPAAIVEGAVISVIAVASLGGDTPMYAGSAAYGVLPYLAVPLLIGGLAGRFVGLAKVVLAVVVVGALTWLVLRGLPTAEELRPAVSWLAVAAVVGIGGAVLHPRAAGIGRRVDDASYRDAIGLIQQLDELSGKLTGGLDPVSLAEDMMAEAEVQLPVQQAAVFSRSPDGEVSPLRYSTFSEPTSFGGLTDFVENCWRSDRPLQRAETVGIPLRSGPRTVGVMVLQLTHTSDQKSLVRVQQALAGKALQLQAGLLFDNVRARATSEERNRLAREVHDGVAQDVASLGYMVDALMIGAPSPQQGQQLAALRTEVTRVVAELRASVYDLRNEMRAGQGLGQGVSSFARQIGSRSDLTVHVRLDEGATRLRPDIEAELLRIAQEAMNNARKHSGGRNLWVSCTVRPPFAEIEVVDDGAGLQRARHDSHGLRIMRERAESIGAQFDVENLPAPETGTRLRVRLGSD